VSIGINTWWWWWWWYRNREVRMEANVVPPPHFSEDVSNIKTLQHCFLAFLAFWKTRGNRKAARPPCTLT
jgi:hypothetical protein